MKKILFLIFFITACSAQPAVPTVTATSESTATITPTSVPKATTTVTFVPTLPPTEAVNNMEKYDIIFTDTQEMSVEGVPITGATSVDATARAFGLRKLLKIDPNTLDDLTARALHNFFVPGGTDNNAEATAWMKGCKAGTPAMRTENVYTTTGGMQTENLTMVMDCGQEIPAGSVPIKGVEIIYGKWFEREQTNNGGIYSANPEMPWLSIIFKKSGTLSGLLVDKEKGLLKVFVGMPFNVSVETLSAEASTKTEIAMDSLNVYPEKLSLDSSTAHYNKAKSWMSALRVE